MQRFYEQEGEFVTLETLIDWVRAHPLRSGRMVPLIIWGGFGIGKTQQIKAYGDARNIKVITYAPAHDVDGSSIVGESYRDPETNQTTYAWPNWLPTEEKDGPKGVLFIDELNRANQEVLAGLMEPLGEGTIAQSGWKLPPGWNIVAAANPSEMGYMVQELDEAMVDRMIHYAPGWDARHWGKWAQSAGVDPEIIEFALRHQGEGGLVVTGEAQLPLEIEQKLRCTPRTLEYMSALYEPGMPDGLLRVCAQGLMGREAGEAYIEQVAAEEKPLTAEEVLQEPTTGPDGQPVYPYDAAVQRWIHDPINGDDLLQVTAELVIIKLLNTELASKDVRHNRVAQLAGRFFARLPEHRRDFAMTSISRSCPEWQDVVMEATLAWLPKLAAQDQLLGTRQAAAVQSGVQPPPQQPVSLPEGGQTPGRTVPQGHQPVAMPHDPQHPNQIPGAGQPAPQANQAPSLPPVSDPSSPFQGG